MHTVAQPKSEKEKGKTGPAPVPPKSAVTRVAVAGATGYAGQELVRLLARHSSVQLIAAMSSGASSTPRRVPALSAPRCHGTGLRPYMGSTSHLPWSPACHM